MQTLRYAWRDGGADHDLHLAPVEGTSGKPFLFGTGPNRQRIEIRDFHIMTTAVTQALWTHVMGSNPAEHEGARRPVENVSWNHITAPGGFLGRDQRVASRMAPGDPFEATKGHPHA